MPVISFDLLSHTLKLQMIRSFLLYGKTLSKVSALRIHFLTYCDKEPSQAAVLCHSLLTQKHVNARVLALWLITLEAPYSSLHAFFSSNTYSHVPAL